MIFFLYGADTFRSRQKLSELKAKFRKDVDLLGTNIVVLDGAIMSVDDFRNATTALSMFTKRRMVIVESLLESGKTEVQNAVAEFIASKDFPSDHIIIFWEGETTKERKNRRTPLRQGSGGQAKEPKIKVKKEEVAMALLPVLLKQKYVQEFEPLLGTQLIRWIQGHAKEAGGTIEPKAVEELVLRVGSDLWRMDQEIKKLVAYRGNERVTLNDVRAHVQGTFTENIFALCDAIGTHERGKALTLIEGEMANGAHPLYLLTMIVRHFRILLMVREELDRGAIEKNLATILQLHPFVVSKSARQAALYTQERLKHLYQQLFSIECALKTSAQDPRALFTQFIAGI